MFNSWPLYMLSSFTLLKPVRSTIQHDTIRLFNLAFNCPTAPLPTQSGSTSRIFVLCNILFLLFFYWLEMFILSLSFLSYFLIPISVHFLRTIDCMNDRLNDFWRIECLFAKQKCAL